MGRSLADVRAVVLTHGHTDHIGFAERARRELKVPVSVHEIDAALARGEIPNRRRARPARSGSGRSCGSCSLPAQGRAADEAPGRGRRRSATARPSTCRARRGSSCVPGPHAGQRGAPCAEPRRAVRRRCPGDRLGRVGRERPDDRAVQRRSGDGPGAPWPGSTGSRRTGSCPAMASRGPAGSRRRSGRSARRVRGRRR